MKNFLKIASVLLALAVLFTSCVPIESGLGEYAEGNFAKDTKEVIRTYSDAEALTPGALKNTSADQYLRAYTQHGLYMEQCSAATETIKVNDLAAMGDTVVGFMFGINKDKKEVTNSVTGKTEKIDVIDFYILGWQPSKNRCYLEHFEDMDPATLLGSSTKAAMADTYGYYDVTAKVWNAGTTNTDDWFTTTGQKTEGNTATLTIRFEQEVDTSDVPVNPTKYAVSIGGQEIAIWDANQFLAEKDKIENGDVAKGGLGAYVNIRAGKSLDATWTISDNEGSYSEVEF